MAIMVVVSGSGSPARRPRRSRLTRSLSPRVVRRHGGCRCHRSGPDQNGGTGVFGLADPLQLPGSSRAMSDSTPFLAALDAPVPRVTTSRRRRHRSPAVLRFFFAASIIGVARPGFHGQVADLGAHHELVGGRDGLGVVALWSPPLVFSGRLFGDVGLPEGRVRRRPGYRTPSPDGSAHPRARTEPNRNPQQILECRQRTP